MKRVWHINSNRWNSAVTEYSLSSAKALALHGWESIYSGLEGRPAAIRAEKAGISCRNFKSFGLSGIKGFLAAKKSIKPDAIIVYGGPETALCRLAGNTPVYRFKGEDSDLSRHIKAWYFALSHGHLKGIITPSKIVQDRFRKLHSHTVCVPLGCDTESFFYQNEPRSNRPTLTIVGRLDPIKGHGSFFLFYSLLLKIWPDKEPRPLLRVIGEPANISIEQIQGFAQDVGLVHGQDWELIPERLPHIRKVMAKSTLGVICSLGSEVICRVAHEFALCGTPIFVSGVGSLEECLIHPSLGHSYKGRNGREVASQLKDLLLTAHKEDQAIRRRRASIARKAFSWETMGLALISHVGPSHLRGLDPSAEPIKP